jgi:hypothetical protein
MGAEAVVLADFEPAERMPMVRGVTAGVSSRALSSELILPAKIPVLPGTLPCLQGDKSSSESSGSMLQENGKHTFYFTIAKKLVIHFLQEVLDLNLSPKKITFLTQFLLSSSV